MKQNKVLLCLMATVVCFVMVSSAFLIAVESNHDCIGKDCHACLEIAASISLLNSIAFVVMIIFAGLGIGSFAYALLQRLQLRAARSTLVALKVKLTI